MNKIKIEVKKRHIEAGIEGNCYECPVALAVLEQTGLEAQINYGKIALYKPVDDGAVVSSHVGSVDMPSSVKSFVKKFDGDKKVKPFNFILDLTGFSL
jgi:hypothetical protein